MAFKEVAIEELQFNPFTKIDKEWFLVTAGEMAHHNTMTASWGGMGVIWGKNVVTVYIRPQRYTKEFVDSCERFTVSFYDEEMRRALQICGSKSGRDCEKEAEAGLTACEIDGTCGFEEANMILVCKKMYHQELLPECFDEKDQDEKWYSAKDYHTMYIAEVEKVLVRA